MGEQAVLFPFLGLAQLGEHFEVDNLCKESYTHAPTKMDVLRF
jgi:hypothetical protein